MRLLRVSSLLLLVPLLIAAPLRPRPKHPPSSRAPSGWTWTAGPSESFDTPHPPEKDPSSVAWTRVPLEDGQLDIGARFAGATNVVACARVTLEADRAALLHLSLGSDDGLAVEAQVHGEATVRPVTP